MHLTLAFIGFVPEARASDAGTALTASLARSGAIHARLGALGAFPSARRPRVVWIGLAAGADEVRDRALRVREVLRARQVPFDDAPPVAHLTIARLRDAATTQDRIALAAAVTRLAPEVPDLGFRIGEAVLYESRLSPRGPTYVPLTRATLS